MNSIKLIILDIDGVMTDGTKTYDVEGNVVSKRFNDKDFTAIKRFKSLGIDVCFLSGDETVNKKIAEKRKIDFYHSMVNGVLNKKYFIPIFCEKYNVKKEEMVFVGDDWFDKDLLDEIDFSFCPLDAIEDVKKCCMVLNRNGGEGVVESLYQWLSSRNLIEKAEDDKLLREIDKKESK